MKSLLSRRGYANVMSTLAFFVAIGGTTIAASKIDGAEIKRNSIAGKSLKKRTIAGKKIRPDAIKGAQVLESTLAQVPAAAQAASAARATTADNAQRVGNRTAAQLTDGCPAETQLYAGACFESEDRAATAWREAAQICGDAGRRLPTMAELEGFRQVPGVTLANGSQPEHTSTVFDSDGNPFNGTTGFVTAGISDSGALSSGFGYGSSSSAAFRCVAPLSNR